MKEKVLEILRGLDIPEFKPLEDLCELPGAYDNMESELPDGTNGKLLDDSKTYLCCQVPINETECYGVAADEKQIAIYRYKNDDSESRVMKVIALQMDGRPWWICCGETDHTEKDGRIVL